jgi:hypothetical protein
MHGGLADAASRRSAGGHAGVELAGIVGAVAVAPAGERGEARARAGALRDAATVPSDAGRTARGRSGAAAGDDGERDESDGEHAGDDTHGPSVATATHER